MKTSALIFILFVSLKLEAQLPEFYVDLVKGEVLQKKARKKAIPVKPRTLLYGNDIIVINKDGTEITLVNKNQEFLVLTKKGNYPVSSLTVKPKEKAHGITEKYFHLVWEELLHPSKDPARYKLENMVGSFGGVSRGGCGPGIYPLADMAVYTDTVWFRWMPDEKSADFFSFGLYDAEQAPLFELFTRDTILVLSKKGLAKADENIFYWKVSSAGGDCEDGSMQKLVWLKPDEFNLRVKEIIDRIDKNAPNYELELSKALADQGFYWEAARHLINAVKN